MSELFSILTKYPVFIAIIVGTISAFIGSLSALVTTIITIRSQRDREREQWVREKLQEIYSIWTAFGRRSWTSCKLKHLKLR